MSRWKQFKSEAMGDVNFDFDVSAIDKDEGDRRLREAVSDRNVSIVERLLASKKIDVNSKNEDGDTLLHIACKKSNRTMVECLLKHGADVAAIGKYNYIPLHWAAKQGKNKTVRLLIRYGSDVLAKNYKGNTALHLAAKQNWTKTAKTLLKTLLKDGGDMEVVNNENETPLNLAQKYNHEKIIDLIDLYIFGSKRRAFDAAYEDKETGRIKSEIKNDLFKIEEVKSVGTGVNRNWSKIGKYGGLAILVEVCTDPEEFKKKYPEYADEPYFIRRIGTRAFLQ